MRRFTVFCIQILLLLLLFVPLVSNGTSQLDTKVIRRLDERDFFCNEVERQRDCIENDAFGGGSWFDDFGFDEGVEHTENTKNALGRIVLSDYELNPDPNCTGLWHFNEGLGNTVLDASGLAHTGTAHGASWTNGIKKKSLTFDGQDDYIDIKNNTFLDNGTIEFWFTPGNNIDADRPLRESLISSGRNYIGFGNFSGELDDSRLYFRISPNSSVSSDLISQRDNWISGEWYHIAVTWSETVQEIYVNGILDNATSKTCSGGWGANLTIGAENILGTARFFKGDVDEVATYNIPLIPERIMEHSKRYHDVGRIISETINLPINACWESIHVNKSEGRKTYINISVIDVFYNEVIEGYENHSMSTLTLKNLPVPSIRLEAWFSGNGENTAILESWGVEWNSTKTMSDSFLGNTKSNAEGDYRLSHSSIHLAPNEYIPDNDTLALWHFDEGIDFSVGDASGNGNTAIIRGANWTEGVMDYSLEFDGINDFLEVPHNKGINPVEDLSISAWVNTSEATGEQQIIVDKRSGAKQGYVLALDAEGNPFFKVGDGTDECRVIGNLDLRDDEWHSIVGTWDSQGGVSVLYVDGIPVVTSVKHGLSSIFNNNSLRMGAASYTETDHLKGSLDEILILDRTLSSREILAISNRVCLNATLRSNTITTPKNHTLDFLYFKRYIPTNCYLNISIRDAETDEILLMDDGKKPQPFNWANQTDPLAHPSVYLFAEFQSDGFDAPVLFWWGINWSDRIIFHIPLLVRNITNVSFEEDTSFKMDLDKHFQDANIPPLTLNYTVQNLVTNPKIAAEMNGSSLLLRSNFQNWTGMERFLVTCINEKGAVEVSNIFWVNVTDVDDRPMWTHSIPDIVIEEDHNSTPVDLFDHVVDAEKDDFWFQHSIDNANISIHISNKTMVIRPAENWSGEAQVKLTVYQRGNSSLYSNTSFNISTLPVNDPPLTTMLFPVNGTMLADNKTTFNWYYEDKDGPEEPIFYVYVSRFLSEIKERAASALHITNKSYLKLDLNHSVYYWTVLGNDGVDIGTCINGYSQFFIDQESLIPDVELYIPVDGTKVNTTNTTLIWHYDGIYRNVEYLLYFGSYPLWTSMDVIQINGTNSENVSYHITGLIDGETYYWYVIPRKGISEGRCISGIWKFTVDFDYERITNISVITNTSEFNLNPGKNYNFTFTLTNNGNENESVTLDLESGIFQGTLDLQPKIFVLSPGEEVFFRLEISVPEYINVENYSISIVARISFRDADDYELSYPITIRIIPEEPGENDELPTEEPMFKEKLGRWFREYWELSIALLSGFAFLFGYLRLRKKKGKFLSLRRQIDNIYKKLSDKPEEAIISLESFSSNLTNYMDKEQITDNQYMILERKINDYILDFRGSARLIQLRKTVKNLPVTVRQKVVEILEDGRVTRDEFDSFEGLLENEDISDGDRDILGKFVGQWLKEDTGEDVEVESGVGGSKPGIEEDDQFILKYTNEFDDINRKETNFRLNQDLTPLSPEPGVQIPKLPSDKKKTLLLQDRSENEIKLDEEINNSNILTENGEMEELDVLFSLNSE